MHTTVVCWVCYALFWLGEKRCVLRRALFPPKNIVISVDGTEASPSFML